MAVAAFVRPKAGSPPSCHLYVANLGPAVGVSVTEASAIFSTFGTVTDIQEAGDCGNRLYISFADREAAQNAKAALHQRPCPAAGGRVMIIQFAELKVTAPTGPPPLEVKFSGQEVGIPGLVYVPECVSEEVERELLVEVDCGNWHRLAKRRVQHYGFEFQYKSRNVDPEQEMGTFPPAFRAVSESIERLLKSLAEASAELSGSALGDSAGQFPSNPQLERNLQTTGRNGLATERFWPLDQLTVNEYPAGVGLSPHVDTHSAFQGAIVSLSLAGPAVMEFRRECQDTEPGLCLPKIDTNDGAHDGQLERRCLFLAPRSLLVLTGEARYAWQHYIPHRKGDVVAGVLTPRGERRVSLTFRKVRTGPCGCEYPECCDSQQGVREGGPKRVREEGWLRMEGARESREPEVGPSTVIPNTTVHRSLEDGGSQDPQVKVDPKTAGYKPQIDPSHGLTPEDSLSPGALRDGSPSASSSSPFVVPEIEKRHVHQVYDAIAMHFSATRFAKWPKVAQFLECLPGGSLVVDAGCGNGKYLGFKPACFFIGCDISAPLVGMASKRGFDVAVADALRLPYRSSSCDAAISIAVLHHLSSDSRRRQAIRELLRVVKSGDRILITVWAREQEDPKLLGKWTPLIGTESWPEDLTAPRGKQSGQKGPPECGPLESELLLQKMDLTTGRGVEERLGDSHPGQEESRGHSGGHQAETGVAEGGARERVSEGRPAGGDGSAPVSGPAADSSDVDGTRISGKLESIPESGTAAGNSNGSLVEVGQKADVGSGSSIAAALSGVVTGPEAPSDTSVAQPLGGAAADSTSTEVNEVSEGGAVSQEDGSGRGQEYFVPWHLPYHRVEVGAADRDGERGLARRDPLKQALVYERYYHVFVEGELERLVTEVGGCTIVDHFFDKSNWCVIAAKE